MAYNTEVFEKAINAFGYVIEEVKKSSPDKVESIFGAIIEGTLVKRVRWDSEGKCFSYKGKELQKYDLPLESIQTTMRTNEVAKQ